MSLLIICCLIDYTLTKILVCCRLLHLSKPGVSMGIVPTAAAAAASLMSNSGAKTL